MTKPKQILQGEEFIIEGYYWSYSLVDNKVKFSVLRKASEKKSRESKPVVIPSEQEIKKYALDNGYDPEFMWEKAKGYIDAGMRDSQDNPVKNLKLKLNQVWFKKEHKIKETTTKTEMVR